MDLGQRIRNTLSRARLTPRHLGGATKVHFVTIYRLMDAGATHNTSSLVEHTLTTALDKIDILLANGSLPIEGDLNRKGKTDKLIALLDSQN